MTLAEVCRGSSDCGSAVCLMLQEMVVYPVGVTSKLGHYSKVLY